MSLNSRHPLFAFMMHQWETMRDFYQGEAAVKERGAKYLPPTEGMCLDGMSKPEDLGWKRYEAYKTRAVVPDYVEEAVEILFGLLNQKDPVIELPPELEPLRGNATVNGESLVTLLRRIHVQQLIAGRCGLLADLSATPSQDSLPYLALYEAETIVNWDDNSEISEFNALNLVVLNESKFVRTGFVWKYIFKYRVCQLGEQIFNDDDVPVGVDNYMQGVFESDKEGGIAYNQSEMIVPQYKGQSLEFIPFTFINTKDILARPDKPPLMALARLCETIYRGEADYRQHLHMQAQETLVVKGGTNTGTNIPGGDNELRTGAGARIDVDVAGDAKYIGVSSMGLSEQRLALENDKTRANIKAGELIQSGGSQQESGQALQTRFTAQTATLNQIAITAGCGLETALKNIARWMGASPDLVVVQPNTEFVDFNLDGLNLINIMQSKQLGLPISFESIHQILVDRGLTVQDFKSEIATIQKENDTVLEIVKSVGINPKPDQQNSTDQQISQNPNDPAKNPPLPPAAKPGKSGKTA